MKCQYNKLIVDLSVFLTRNKVLTRLHNFHLLTFLTNGVIFSFIIPYQTPALPSMDLDLFNIRSSFGKPLRVCTQSLIPDDPEE